MSQLKVICPLFLGGDYSETDCFGSAVWLWMHSENHKAVPLYALPTLLLPAIKRQQFVLMLEGDKPVFFMSWAWMNEDSEKKYIKNSVLSLSEDDWHSGERMWLIDWIAPFGHTRQCSSIVLKDILQDFCFRSLYHKSDEKGQQARFYKGKNITASDVKTWLAKYPLTVDI